MKILILSDRYPPYYEGGYELICRDTAEQLSRRGHLVSILTTKYGINAAKIEGNVFRLLECCGWDNMISIHKRYLQAQLKRAFMFRKNYWIAQRTIKKISPDIVYVWQLCDAFILPIIAAQQRGIPCVFDIGTLQIIR